MFVTGFRRHRYAAIGLALFAAAALVYAVSSGLRTPGSPAEVLRAEVETPPPMESPEEFEVAEEARADEPRESEPSPAVVVPVSDPVLEVVAVGTTPEPAAAQPDEAGVEQVLVQFITDDPDVLIYWLVDAGDGGISGEGGV